MPAAAPAERCQLVPSASERNVTQAALTHYCLPVALAAASAGPLGCSGTSFIPSTCRREGQMQGGSGPGAAAVHNSTPSATQGPPPSLPLDRLPSSSGRLAALLKRLKRLAHLEQEGKLHGHLLEPVEAAALAEVPRACAARGTPRWQEGRSRRSAGKPADGWPPPAQNVSRVWQPAHMVTTAVQVCRTHGPQSERQQHHQMAMVPAAPLAGRQEKKAAHDQAEPQCTHPCRT